MAGGRRVFPAPRAQSSPPVRAGAAPEARRRSRELVEEVRAWFAAHGRRKFTWVIGDSATPSDLRERLLRLGAYPDADEPVYAGMVPAEPPPAVERFEVRPVETFEEFAAARELTWAVVGGMGEEEREAARAGLEEASEE